MRVDEGLLDGTDFYGDYSAKGFVEMIYLIQRISETSLSSAGEEALPTTKLTQTVESQQASPVIDSISVGTDETVSDPIGETGTSEFRAVTEETPTDQYGTSRLIFGDSESVTESENEFTMTAAAGNAETNSVVNMSILDTIGKPLENAEAGDGATTVTPIEAEDLEALGWQRRIEKSPAPVIPEGIFDAGHRLLEVLVEFTVTSKGFVAGDVTFIRSSGITKIDAAITEVIRQWKFEQVASEKDERVRLRYIITAE